MDAPEIFFAPQKFFSLKLFSTILIFFDNREQVLAAHYWELDMRHIPLTALWSEFSDPELDTLLHPASAFDHPRDVVRDLDLTVEEKRAILSSWASDACAVESQPASRRPPGSKQPVEFDEIVDALRSLEKGQPPKWKRVVGRARSGSNETP